MLNLCRLPDCYPVSLSDNDIKTVEHFESYFQSYTQQNNWNVPYPICTPNFQKTIESDPEGRCHYNTLEEAQAACNTITGCEAVVQDSVGYEPRTSSGFLFLFSGSNETPSTWYKKKSKAIASPPNPVNNPPPKSEVSKYLQQDNWNVPNPICLLDFKKNIEFDKNNFNRCHYNTLEEAKAACNTITGCEAVVKDQFGYEPRISFGLNSPGMDKTSTTWHRHKFPVNNPPPNPVNNPPPNPVNNPPPKSDNSVATKQLVNGVDNMVLFGGMGFLLIILIVLIK